MHKITSWNLSFIIFIFSNKFFDFSPNIHIHPFVTILVPLSLRKRFLWSQLFSLLFEYEKNVPFLKDNFFYSWFLSPNIHSSAQLSDIKVILKQQYSQVLCSAIKFSFKKFLQIFYFRFCTCELWPPIPDFCFSLSFSILFRNRFKR